MHRCGCRCLLWGVPPQDAGSLTVYVNRLLVGTPFTNLPRGEKLYPVLGVGCLAPNIYSTDFDAVAPAPQGEWRCTV